LNSSSAKRLDRWTTRFFALGLYVVFESGHALWTQDAPETSLIGIALAIASMVVMPVLFFLKFRLGMSIGSRSLVADSKETLACVLLSVALLVGLGAYSIWKVWWIDSVAALVIAALIFRKGLETFRESREGVVTTAEIAVGHREVLS